MLAISDPYGIVSASIPGLASVSNVSVDETRLAVKNLLSPDPDSRTKDYEGRRIEEIDGGWRILNYVKYRKMLSEAERADYKAKWIREKRRQMSTLSTESDVNGQKSTDASASSSTSSSASVSDVGKTFLIGEVLKVFNEEWIPTRKAMGKRPKDWTTMFLAQAKWLSQFKETDQLEILSQSIRNNWQGLQEPKKQYGTNQKRNTQGGQGIGRGVGTLNEGTSSQYRGIGKIGEVPNHERPATGTNET